MSDFDLLKITSSRPHGDGSIFNLFNNGGLTFVRSSTESSLYKTFVIFTAKQGGGLIMM